MTTQTTTSRGSATIKMHEPDTNDFIWRRLEVDVSVVRTREYFDGDQRGHKTITELDGEPDTIELDEFEMPRRTFEGLFGKTGLKALANAIDDALDNADDFE